MKIILKLQDQTKASSMSVPQELGGEWSSSSWQESEEEDWVVGVMEQLRGVTRADALHTRQGCGHLDRPCVHLLTLCCAQC